MADEEFRVEVVLGNDEHRLTFWERLRALDLDDDAQEAERTAKELVADDRLDAHYTIPRWHADSQDWADPSVPVGPHDATEDAAKNANMEVPDPRYVVMQAYKPEFLRDLGL